MDQFRWFHIVELFFFPIFVEGVFLLFTKWKVQRWFVHGVWAVPATLFVVVEVTNSVDFAMGPETSVNDIHRRVRYMSWVQQRLDVDDITLLDVDMGAHMYYSGWDIVDIAGLIDVSMAQHSDFNFSFIRQYIFEERNPEFAHVHGGWAKTSRIPKHKEWKQRYLEIPGYPVGGRTLHIGNHVRKDLFIQEYDLTKKPAAISFGEGLSLVEYSLSAKEVAAGDLLYLYTAWNSQKDDADIQSFFIVVDAEGNLATVSSFQPGFRWYNREEWGSKELIEGRFRLPIPKDLTPGTYSLRLAVVSHNHASTYGEIQTDYVFLPQEVDLGLQISIVSKEEAHRYANEDWEQSLRLASEGDCEAAWPTFKEATRHRLRSKHWRKANEESVRQAIAKCWIQRATTQEEKDKIQSLQVAREWDRHAEGLIEASAPLAELLDARGQDLFEEAIAKKSYLLGKPIFKQSYEAFLNAMRLDPSRSWTRRRLEDARDKYLRIKRPAEKRKEKDRRERERKKKQRKSVPKLKTK